jgi:GxxExxY protein
MLKSANQNTMQYHEITQLIIGKAIEVHKFLGKGLLESAYRECLYYELKNAGLVVEKEKPMPVVYKEVKLDHGFRIDLLVENAVVIELKSVDQLHELHVSQTLTYMKLGQFKTGLLINFNVPMLKDGLKRLVLS